MQLYKMPIFLREFNYKRLADRLEKEKEMIEKKK
jgi:hypothetical protein